MHFITVLTRFLLERQCFASMYIISKRRCFANITSVCLIYFPESTADSKKSLGGKKIPNTISQSFNCAPIILKFFRLEISMVVEISIDFNLLGIIGFQVYCSILPILLKSGNCEVILPHCVLITQFAIGSGHVIKCGRYSDASCERFGEIRRGYPGLVRWDR